MFKTKEEKRQIKETKQLAQQEAQELATQQRLEEISKKMGLNNLDYQDVYLADSINPKHLGSGLISFGTLLQGNGVDSTKIDMTKSLIAQNWFMIRQNDKIISLLNQIANK